MITDQDVQKIITAGSQVFATKTELVDVEKRVDGKLNALQAELNSFEQRIDVKFDTLFTAVDGYAKKADTFMQELVVTRHQVDRHDKWLHLIADKLGVKLEY
jgi:flagellar capping protein FliD